MDPCNISTDVTNLVFGEFRIAMGNIGRYSSFLNGNNERHNRSMEKILEEDLLTVINMGKNGYLHQKHLLKYIDSKYTVHYITSRLVFYIIGRRA